jgi:hypothetical protein
MYNANVTISRKVITGMRARDCGFTRGQAACWRKLFADSETYVAKYQADDIGGDLGFGASFVTELTGAERFTIYSRPRASDSQAYGGTGYRQETVAHAIGLMHVLGAISPPWDVLAPLIARIKKRRKLTAEELHVLWGQQEARVPRLFTWPADTPEPFPNTLEAARTYHGNIVLTFKDPDGIGKELVTPAGWFRLKTVAEHLADAGAQFRRPADIKRLVDAAALTEWREHRPVERTSTDAELPAGQERPTLH